MIIEEIIEIAREAGGILLGAKRPEKGHTYRVVHLAGDD